jgi:hypothetical protein|tara:strand:+ start:3802 stop:4188 length:387 start_codon:yes stop_codon:yes gene_type:complete
MMPEDDKSKQIGGLCKVLAKKVADAIIKNKGNKINLSLELSGLEVAEYMNMLHFVAGSIGVSPGTKEAKDFATVVAFKAMKSIFDALDCGKDASDLSGAPVLCDEQAQRRAEKRLDKHKKMAEKARFN